MNNFIWDCYILLWAKTATKSLHIFTWKWEALSHSQFMLPKQSTIATEHRYYRVPLLQSTVTTEHHYYRAPLLSGLFSAHAAKAEYHYCSVPLVQSTVTEQLILSSRCQSRVPLLTSLNSECLLLTVQEAGKTKIKVPADKMSGEDLLLALQTDVFSFYPHMAQNWEYMRALSCLLRGRYSHSWGATLMA